MSTVVIYGYVVKMMDCAGLFYGSNHPDSSIFVSPINQFAFLERLERLPMCFQYRNRIEHFVIFVRSTVSPVKLKYSTH